MHPYIPQIHDALIQDPVQGGWLLFRRPIHTFVAMQVEEVLPVLKKVDQALNEPGAYAAGFIAYEAAPGLDPALKTNPIHTFPLVWFGIYHAPVVLPSLPDPVPGDSRLSAFRWSATVNQQEYELAIEKVKNYIALGDTYQVNYTYRLHSEFQGNLYATFVDLARAQRANYTAFIHLDRFTLCSASPELFFSLEGDLLTSKPMKGTATRGVTLQEDLEQASWLSESKKDQAENVMIVDMVRNDIGKIARTGSVRVPELFSVEKYPTVWQMVSTVTGKTEARLSEIFRALFPPASITGAPKARTMEIIRELENTSRRIYTGCIGYAGPDRRALFNVSIRTMLTDRVEKQAEYGIGGGITWSSIDSAEFEESRAKAKILTVRIPRFSLLESLLWEPGPGYFLLDRHLARLRDSAEYFSYNVDLSAIQRELSELAGSFCHRTHKVRLMVDEEGRVTIEAEAIDLAREKRFLNTSLAPEPVNAADPFLFHKTTHRKVYERARLSIQDQEPGEWDEVILWNEKGEVTEATTANIIVELDGSLYTPPISCGLLNGTYRAWLLEQGIIQEKIIRLEDLPECSKIYLINSVRKQREAKVRIFEDLCTPG